MFLICNLDGRKTEEMAGACFRLATHNVAVDFFPSAVRRLVRHKGKTVRESTDKEREYVGGPIDINVILAL